MKWGERLVLWGLILALLTSCSGISFNLGPETVKLRFVYMEGAADYETLAREFSRQNTNITIVLEPVSRQSGYDELAAKLKDADAVRMMSLAVSSDMAAGLLPLDMRLETDKNFPTADLFPGSLQAMKVNGRTLGVPAGLNPFVIFYLPGKFADAGVEVPRPDWTLKEFVQAANAVNQPDPSLLGTDRYTYGFCSHPRVPDPVIFSYLFGGGLFDSLTEISKPTLNLRENLDALTWYAGLQRDLGLMPDTKDPAEVGRLIANGSCAFWMDMMDPSSWGGMRDLKPAMLPLPTQAEPINIASLDSYSVMAASTHPDQAWQWISYLVSQPGAAGRLIPPFKAEALRMMNAPLSADAMTIASHLPSKMIILSPQVYTDKRFTRVFNVYSEVAAEITSGTVDAKSTLDLAQELSMEGFK